MKIGPAADLPLVSPTLNPAQTPAAAPNVASAPAAPPEATKVALSSTAAELRTMPSSAEFDAEKVSRIASAIAEGRFQVNPGAIADKLIANARELLSRNQA
jgi:negative regulator of flagellin synthesis FlgM